MGEDRHRLGRGDRHAAQPDAEDQDHDQGDDPHDEQNRRPGTKTLEPAGMGQRCAERLAPRGHAGQ